MLAATLLLPLTLLAFALAYRATLRMDAQDAALIRKASGK